VINAVRFGWLAGGAGVHWRDEFRSDSRDGVQERKVARGEFHGSILVIDPRRADAQINLRRVAGHCQRSRGRDESRPTQAGEATLKLGIIPCLNWLNLVTRDFVDAEDGTAQAVLPHSVGAAAEPSQ